MNLATEDDTLSYFFYFLLRARQIHAQHHTMAILLKENSIYLTLSLPRQCKKTSTLRDTEPSMIPTIEIKFNKKSFSCCSRVKSTKSNYKRRRSYHKQRTKASVSNNRRRCERGPLSSSKLTHPRIY